MLRSAGSSPAAPPQQAQRSPHLNDNVRQVVKQARCNHPQQPDHRAAAGSKQSTAPSQIAHLNDNVCQGVDHEAHGGRKNELAGPVRLRVGVGAGRV